MEFFFGLCKMRWGDGGGAGALFYQALEWSFQVPYQSGFWLYFRVAFALKWNIHMKGSYNIVGLGSGYFLQLLISTIKSNCIMCNPLGIAPDLNPT